MGVGYDNKLYGEEVYALAQNQQNTINQAVVTVRTRMLAKDRHWKVEEMTGYHKSLCIE